MIENPNKELYLFAKRINIQNCHKSMCSLQQLDIFIINMRNHPNFSWILTPNKWCRPTLFPGDHLSTLLAAWAGHGATRWDASVCFDKNLEES